MFKRKKYLALLLALVMSTITVSGCANFGSDPDADLRQLKRIYFMPQAYLFQDWVNVT